MRLPRPLVPIALLLVLAAPPLAARSRRPSRKSPHCEIVATAVVDSVPAPQKHKNGREFLEFDVTIERFSRAPEGDDDAELPVATGRPVHVVHDLSCGGVPLSLARGQGVEIKGEYVAPSNGKDLIHFTHPANGDCGRGGGHADGYIRPR